MGSSTMGPGVLRPWPPPPPLLCADLVRILSPQEFESGSTNRARVNDRVVVSSGQVEGEAGLVLGLVLGLEDSLMARLGQKRPASVE